MIHLPLTKNFPWLDVVRPILQTKEWIQQPKLAPHQHHAVLYPGLATPAASLALLHLALQSKGVVCHEWEQGFNTGLTPEVEGKAMEHLVRLMRAHPNTQWHLIGWSLGGLLARDLAKHLNEPGLRCTSVTTMGTPINDLPDNQRLLTIYRLLNKELPTKDFFFEKKIYVSPPCRSLSIYSQQDSVVPWKTCIQSPLHKGHVTAFNHEVEPGHMAMINHPATWTLLVQWMGDQYKSAPLSHQYNAEREAGAYWASRTP